METNYNQFINGTWSPASGGGTWEVKNPADETTVATVPFGDGSDAIRAIEAASAAFKTWSTTNPFDRAVILKKAGALMHERLEHYARTTVMESGKPLVEAIGEWRIAANFFEWYAEEGKRNAGTVLQAARNNKRMSVIHQPLGVVGAITAWNFPAYNPARCWSAALGAGCTVVAKASEYTPLTAMLLAQCLQDAGLPAGVLNLVNGDAASIGQAMLDHPAVRKISFTGSTRVGRILMDGASKTHTLLALELGGNAPVLVFPEVDLEKVAAESIVAKLRNAGQTCVAPQRFLVHESIAGRFIEMVEAKMRSIKMGHGLDPATEMGPIINASQRDHLEALVKESIAHGGELVTGGGRGNFGAGYFFEPTLVRITTQDNPLFRREIFGPVMPVTTFRTTEEAISLANDTEYGLASYIWTDDLDTSIHVSEQLEFGMVGINEWYPWALEAPFGGWKQSGLGYECGREGLAEYQEKKLISIGGL